MAHGVGRASFRAGLRLGAEISYQLEDLTPTASEYMELVSTLLHKVVPGDVVAWNGVDLDTGEVGVFAAPGQPWHSKEMAQQLADVLDDHPMATSYFADLLDTSPRRISDVTTRSEFFRTKAYADLYRLMSADQQVTLLTTAPGARQLHCWAVNRLGTDFSDDEVALLKALQPVLAALERAHLVGVADSGDLCRRSPVGQSELPGDAERLRLTCRELQVLAALADGLTASAIGHLLRISPHTARKHLENIYRKFDCHDRMLVVRRARELGLLGGVPQPLADVIGP